MTNDDFEETGPRSRGGAPTLVRTESPPDPVSGRRRSFADLEARLAELDSRFASTAGAGGETRPAGAPAAPRAAQVSVGRLVPAAQTVAVAPPARNGAPGPLANIRPIQATSGAEEWGWLPALSLTGALGLLLIALADNEGRAGGAAADLLFWVGLLVLFAPVAARLASPGPSRRERIGLVGVLGLGLYLVKVLHSPLAFTFYDELLHWRLASDVAQSGHLFRENPLLPVSPLYPALGSVTTALATLSELTIFSAGVVVIGVARLVLLLALYLFYEEISGSARVASIASLLYTANPNFVFFGGQFAYESLGLPLAALALWAAARRARAPAGSRMGPTVVLVLGLGAVVVTHHVTSYALAAFLSLWTVAAWMLAAHHRRRGAEERPTSGGGALLALVAAMAWLVYVASLVVGYLAQNLAGGVSELLRLIAGEATIRELFRTSAGQLAPLGERLIGSASVALVLLGLPFGLLQVWRRHRADALSLALAAAALAYPASLALRLTERGALASNRTSEFIFVAIAFVLAVGVAELWLPGRPGWRRPAAFTGWAIVIFMGGVIVGWPFWARLPGPYLVAADPRSIEAQGIAAAEWARGFLGPGNRIASDRINGVLMGSYGEQRLVTGYGDGVNASEIFFPAEFGAAERAILQHGRIRYVVVDRRLSSALPLVVYFEQGEHASLPHTTPIDPAALAKFDRLQHVSRVFDSGDIVIYDVGALARGS